MLVSTAVRDESRLLSVNVGERVGTLGRVLGAPVAFSPVLSVCALVGRVPGTALHGASLLRAVRHVQPAPDTRGNLRFSVPAPAAHDAAEPPARGALTRHLVPP